MSYAVSYPIKYVLIGGAMALLALSGCSEQQQTEAADTDVVQIDPIEYSDPRVCDFARELAVLDAEQPDLALLRYLNEQWRDLKRTDAMSLIEERDSRALLTDFNYQLAEQSIELLKQVAAITTETWDRIEGLRRFANDPDNMKVPDSIIRDFVTQLEACCLRPLEGNAVALLSEDKESVLYAIGRRAYFVERDVNQILNNDRDLAAYRGKIDLLEAQLPPAPAVDADTDWVSCPAT
ncbi:hypothetical protein [Pseudidiomarina sp.]|uniref:hypothetical protein n=1 Tax=Pseudidiomarina sp. TaxID=2081707 RepID=UPI00299DF191|nr:hypothetical protein [Pseudidiomarina sp.]MDX1706572.1 hypothetical protein [Pseudidiomarina sp.]